MTHNDVHKFLGRCPMELIRYIQIQLALAEDMRRYEQTFCKSPEEAAKDMQLPLRDYKMFCKGAYPASLKEMATLRTLYATRIARRNAGVQIKGEGGEDAG